MQSLLIPNTPQMHNKQQHYYKKCRRNQASSIREQGEHQPEAKSAKAKEQKKTLPNPRIAETSEMLEID